MLTRLVAAARGSLVRWWLRRRTAGTRPSSALLSSLPDPMLVPLRRDLLDPVPALRHQQEASPVAPLILPFGARGWLVTGHAEARVVLAASADFSNDFEHLVGRGGIAAEDHPGGLGFTDPPEHTRLR